LPLAPVDSLDAAPLESKFQSVRNGNLQAGTCRANARRSISDLSLIQIWNLQSKIDNRLSAISN
jgi:hypothetical protein